MLAAGLFTPKFLRGEQVIMVVGAQELAGFEQQLSALDRRVTKNFPVALLGEYRHHIRVHRYSTETWEVSKSFTPVTYSLGLRWLFGS